MNLLVNEAYASEEEVMDTYGAYNLGVRGVIQGEIYALDEAAVANYFTTQRLSAFPPEDGNSPDVPHLNNAPDNAKILSEKALTDMGIKLPIDTSKFECIKTSIPSQRTPSFYGAPENPWAFRTRLPIAGKDTRVTFSDNVMYLDQSNDDFATKSRSTVATYVWAHAPSAKPCFAEVMKAVDLDEKTALNILCVTNNSLFGIAHTCDIGCQFPQLGAYEMLSDKSPQETMNYFKDNGLIETMRTKIGTLQREPTALENQLQNLMLFATVIRGQCLMQAPEDATVAKFNLTKVPIHEGISSPDKPRPIVTLPSEEKASQ